MARRRRRLIAGLALIAAGGVASAFLIVAFTTSGGPETALFDSIDAGMTLAEVEGIIGRKPSMSVPGNGIVPERSRRQDVAATHVWTDRHEGMIAVLVDANGLVLEKHNEALREMTFLRRALIWLFF